MDSNAILAAFRSALALAAQIWAAIHNTPSEGELENPYDGDSALRLIHVEKKFYFNPNAEKEVPRFIQRVVIEDEASFYADRFNLVSSDGDTLEEVFQKLTEELHGKLLRVKKQVP